MIEIDEKLKELKRLHEEGFIKENDFIEKLQEIEERKEELRRLVEENTSDNNARIKNISKDQLIALGDLKAYYRY